MKLTARRWIGGVGAAVALSLAAAGGASAAGPPRGAVYVESQGLCYETFETTDLPNRGPLQLIEPDPLNRCGEGSSKTPYGPGDPGYTGGRWITPEGRTFQCPLVGPGSPPLA